MISLLETAKSIGQLSKDADIDTLVLSCRALVYGLARMHVDGHFLEWQPEGDPAEWMKRSLALFIRKLRGHRRAPS